MKRSSINIATAAVILLISAVALAACGTSAPAGQNPPVAAPTTAPAAAPTAAPTTVPTPAAADNSAGIALTGLKITKDATLGNILSDQDGRVLYMFTKDTKNMSNCYAKCAAAWPPALSDGKPTLPDGIDASVLSTTTRKDGKSQLVVNGMPVYYYTPDKNPGDTKGQGVGKVWWVLSPEGNLLRPAGITVVKNDKFGQFLADDQGRSLYMFTKDTQNTSNCNGKCEQAWPPLLTVGQPTLGDGVDQSKVGTTTRKDGSMQVTYNGMPLYYYTPDTKPGDVNGQNVGKVWFIVAPDGTVTKTAS